MLVVLGWELWLAACGVGANICGAAVVCRFEMEPSVSVIFMSLATSCVGLWEEEPQTAFCSWDIKLKPINQAVVC